MGKLDLFKAVISNPDGVCRAGDKVTGFVLVTLNANMKMRGINISFKGQAHVKFDKGDDTYRCREDYFEEQHVLYKTTDAQNYLPQGEHRFDFQYQLDPNLPSTFEGEYGYVRYYVKCRIDKPWKFDHTAKEVFTVLSVLDLNLQAENELPIHLEDNETACCCCCKGGEGTLKLDIPRKGYVPGESIPVTVSLDSTVDNPFTLKVQFFQKTLYHASGHTKEEKRKITQLDSMEINGNQSYTLTNKPLLIPPLPPSGLIHCDIIDIEYVLRVEAIGGFVVLVCKALLEIGTVPLRSPLNITQYGIPLTELPSQTFSNVTDAYPNPQAYGATYSDTDIPPPSYAECVFGNVGVRDNDDDKYTMGSTVYTPRYDYFSTQFK